jgi:hypothetical protein
MIKGIYAEVFAIVTISFAMVTTLIVALIMWPFTTAVSFGGRLFLCSLNVKTGRRRGELIDLLQGLQKSTSLIKQQRASDVQEIWRRASP